MTRGRRRGVDPSLWLLAWGFLGLNLFFSFVPPPPGTDVFAPADKLGHFGSYACAVAAFLLAAVWRPGRGPGRYPRAASAVVAVAVALSVASEALQGTVFDRDAQVLDTVADLLGVAAAYAGWRVLRGPGSTAT